MIDVIPAGVEKETPLVVGRVLPTELYPAWFNAGVIVGRDLPAELFDPAAEDDIIWDDGPIEEWGTLPL